MLATPVNCTTQWLMDEIAIVEGFSMYHFFKFT